MSQSEARLRRAPVPHPLPPQANAFLVTWLDERVQVSGNSARVAGRLVRYQAGGTPSFVTAAFTVNQKPRGCPSPRSATGAASCTSPTSPTR